MEKLIEDFQIPDKKIETWKYTDLKKVLEKNNFRPSTKSDAKPAGPSKINLNILNNIFFDPKINFIIFENGYLKKINIVSNDLEIKSLDSNLEDKIFNKKNFTRNDSLLDINSFFLNDNLVIKVKKNTKLKKPISIFYYNCEEEKYLINNRVNIILEENAEAEINEIFFSNNKSIYWNNVHNYICLKKNSKLEHYKVQLESKNAVHSSSSSIDCENSSIYNNFIFSVGGNMSRIEVISSINSADINFNIKGLYLAKTNQHHDIPL